MSAKYADCLNSIWFAAACGLASLVTLWLVR